MSRLVSLAMAVLVSAFVLLSAPGVLAAEKLTLGTSYKLASDYYLTAYAAEEQGFWGQKGLEVKYVPFMGAEVYRGVVAGDVHLGLSDPTSQIPAASRGIPIVLVAELSTRSDFSIWVLPETPRRKPEEIRGAKIATGRFFGASHFFGLVAMKALGLEREVKFVAVGGLAERMAALKTGRIDALVDARMTMASLFLGKQVRELISTADYLPKEWMKSALFVRKDLIKAKPEVVQKAVDAYLQAVSFVKSNPAWAVGKMKQVSGFSEEVAKFVYEKAIVFTEDGKIKRKTMENIVNFLIDYSVMAKEKILPLEELYTDRFTK